MIIAQDRIELLFAIVILINLRSTILDLLGDGGTLSLRSLDSIEGFLCLCIAIEIHAAIELADDGCFLGAVS